MTAGGGALTTELSITTPTYQRPDGLRTALQSIVETGIDTADRVEIVVSDNSTDTRSEEVIRPLLDAWKGPTRYVRHVPSLGMVGNHNACLEMANGRWQLILHDDDYLLPGGLQLLLDGLEEAGPDEHVLLFGVRVVDEHGHRLRLQRFRRRQRLSPPDALRRLLTGSSFVRIPAVCVRTDAYAQVGGFDQAVGGVEDYDMWIRLFARYGVTLDPRTIAAYVVHSEAETEGLFDVEGVEMLGELYRRAAQTGVLEEAELQSRQRQFLHQFILAGTFRRLKRRNWAQARQVMTLFSLPGVRRLGVSGRWLPVRLCFAALTRLATIRS